MPSIGPKRVRKATRKVQFKGTYEGLDKGKLRHSKADTAQFVLRGLILHNGKYSSVKRDISTYIEKAKNRIRENTQNGIPQNFIEDDRIIISNLEKQLILLERIGQGVQRGNKALDLFFQKHIVQFMKAEIKKMSFFSPDPRLPAGLMLAPDGTPNPHAMAGLIKMTQDHLNLFSNMKRILQIQDIQLSKGQLTTLNNQIGLSKRIIQLAESIDSIPAADKRTMVELVKKRIEHG